jgi:hypothetical protein
MDEYIFYTSIAVFFKGDPSRFFITCKIYKKRENRFQILCIKKSSLPVDREEVLNFSKEKYFSLKKTPGKYSKEGRILSFGNCFSRNFAKELSVLFCYCFTIF